MLSRTSIRCCRVSGKSEGTPSQAYCFHMASPSKSSLPLRNLRIVSEPSCRMDASSDSAYAAASASESLSAIPSSSTTFFPESMSSEKRKAVSGHDASVEDSIEKSKVHWSELTERSQSAEEEAEVSNVQAFQSLQKHPTCGSFFRTFGDGGIYDCGKLEVGEKFAADSAIDRLIESIAASDCIFSVNKPAPQMTGLEAVGGGGGGNPTHCLAAEEDKFGGVVVDVLGLSPTDVPAFVDSLHLSLELWRSQKKKGVWLKLPTEYSLFVHPAIQEGFKYHHAEPDYAMLVHWLSAKPCTLPANASHHVGVDAFVLNDRQEILAVQEKFGPFHDKWTMPTGRVHQGEDIFAGAIRELREETGIDTEFVEVIGFRQSHTAPFGKSDVFFLCVLRPLSSTVKVQESELTDAKWLPLAEFQAQEYLSERKMLKRMLDVCIETTKSSKGFRMENVQSGTPRGPQYFYTSTTAAAPDPV